MKPVNRAPWEDIPYNVQMSSAEYAQRLGISQAYFTNLAAADALPRDIDRIPVNRQCYLYVRRRNFTRPRRETQAIASQN